MTRKFVTGDSKTVVCEVERKAEEAKCSGCGVSVSIMTPCAGDILCPKCLQTTSYSLERTDGKPQGD